MTNGNVALLQQICAAGWGLHANTPGDIYLGLQAGFSPQKIIYSGSNLSIPDMKQALDWGVRTFNLDSVQQVQQLAALYQCREHYQNHSQNHSQNQPQNHQQSETTETTLKLGLRLNLPEVTGGSRIGVRPEDFDTAQSIAQSAGLTISGLHFYRGTGTNATRSFTQAMAPVLAAAQQLPDWQYLDFGGGFGYGYRPGGVAFDWPTFGEAITQQISQLEVNQPIVNQLSQKQRNRPIQLIIEPGRAAIAGCATLLTEVVSVKWQGDRQIIGVDTTVANLSVPAVHGGYRTITTWANDDEELFPSDVCGNTTYSRDYLGRNCQLPALKPGDHLAVLDVGAYGYAMSSHFLHRPRPAEVLLEANVETNVDTNTHRLIRQREDYSVLLAQQVF